MPFQLAAARRRLVFTSDNQFELYGVSTRSRPKAAGTALRCRITPAAFQLAAARRRLVIFHASSTAPPGFQLAAARRRLVNMEARQKGAEAVSTRSRPKAAGSMTKLPRAYSMSFNSQPPEGGWLKVPVLTF